MKNCKIFLLLFLSIAVHTYAIDKTNQCVPSIHRFTKWIQSSGDTITVRVIDDKYCCYYTVDGYALAKNIEGNLCYARIDRNGNLKPTTILASRPDGRTKQELRYIDKMKSNDKLLIFAVKRVKSMMRGRTFVRKSAYDFRTDTISFIDDSICIVTNHFFCCVSDVYKSIRIKYRYSIKPSNIPYEYLPRDTSLCFVLHLENTSDSIIQLPAEEYEKIDFYHIDGYNYRWFDENGNPRDDMLPPNIFLSKDRWTPITENYASVYSSDLPLWFYNYAKCESQIMSFDAISFYVEGSYLFFLMNASDNKQNKYVSHNYIECGEKDLPRDSYSWAEKRAAFVLLNIDFDTW